MVSQSHVYMILFKWVNRPKEHILLRSSISIKSNDKVIAVEEHLMLGSQLVIQYLYDQF